MLFLGIYLSNLENFLLVFLPLFKERQHKQNILQKNVLGYTFKKKKNAVKC